MMTALVSLPSSVGLPAMQSVPADIGLHALLAVLAFAMSVGAACLVSALLASSRTASTNLRVLHRAPRASTPRAA